MTFAQLFLILSAVCFGIAALFVGVHSTVPVLVPVFLGVALYVLAEAFEGKALGR